MDIVQIIIALVSGGSLSALFTAWTMRRKRRAEADNIQVRSEIKIGEFAKLLADDLNERLEAQVIRCDRLQEQLDELKKENLELRSALQRKEIQTELHISALERKIIKKPDDESKR